VRRMRNCLRLTHHSTRYSATSLTYSGRSSCGGTRYAWAQDHDPRRTRHVITRKDRRERDIQWIVETRIASFLRCTFQEDSGVGVGAVAMHRMAVRAPAADRGGAEEIL
jgi:hypothetical protein